MHVIITYLTDETGCYKAKHIYGGTTTELEKNMQVFYNAFNNPLKPLIIAHITYIGG